MTSFLFALAAVASCINFVLWGSVIWILVALAWVALAVHYRS